jgi:hypothetical protein
MLLKIANWQQKLVSKCIYTQEFAAHFFWGLVGKAKARTAGVELVKAPAFCWVAFSAPESLVFRSPYSEMIENDLKDLRLEEEQKQQLSSSLYKWIVHGGQPPPPSS